MVRFTCAELLELHCTSSFREPHRGERRVDQETHKTHITNCIDIFEVDSVAGEGKVRCRQFEL